MEAVLASGTDGQKEGKTLPRRERICFFGVSEFMRLNVSMNVRKKKTSSTRPTELSGQQVRRSGNRRRPFGKIAASPAVTSYSSTCIQRSLRDNPGSLHGSIWTGEIGPELMIEMNLKSTMPPSLRCDCRRTTGHLDCTFDP